MKKVFFTMMAVVAIGFTSCGSKSASEAPADGTEVVADVDLEAATADLAAQLEAGDVNGFQAAIETAKAKVAEILTTNPELAQEYLTKVQDFLKENTEKITALVGDNQVVSTLVSSVAEAPAESIISSLKEQLGATEAAGQAVVDNAKEQADAAVDAAKQAAADKVNEAANKANEKINEGADKLLKGAGLK